MDLHLHGKLALVTASTGGIGKEIAATLAREGATVIINGRTDATVDQTIKELRSRMPEARLERLVADKDSAIMLGRRSLVRDPHIGIETALRCEKSEQQFMAAQVAKLSIEHLAEGRTPGQARGMELADLYLRLSLDHPGATSIELLRRRAWGYVVMGAQSLS